MHAEHHFEFGFLPKKSEKKESVGVSVCVCNFKRVRERGEGKVKRERRGRVGSGGKTRRGFIVSERALFQTFAHWSSEKGGLLHHHHH